MNVISPGIEFYAGQIRKGSPFTLVRYGEGEWRCAVPTLPPKGDRKHRIRGPKYMRDSAKIWSDKKNREVFRQTLVDLHRHPRYFPAAWHLNVLKKCGWLDEVQAWLVSHHLDDVEWHSGWVFRKAVESHRMGIVIKAIRKQPLPIVVVAPERMQSIKDRLSVVKFIVSPIPSRPDHISDMVQEVLGMGEPALVIFCAGVAGKIAIHRLFPQVGEYSFMIDFGATLDGMCGNRVRGYHGPESLSAKAIEENWGQT